MKRVLIVGFTENPGGIENVIMNYYRAMDKENIQFDFLCNTSKIAYEEEIKLLGGKIFKISSRTNNYKKYKKDMKAFFENNANNYIAIWVNFCNLTNLDYLKYAKKYKINYRIMHSHNSQNMASKVHLIVHMINKIFVEKYATHFWACSDDAGRWFFNSKIMKSDKYRIVNNAIDMDKFGFSLETRNEMRKKLDLDGKFVIGNIGRLHFQKNHTFILDIFKEILNKNKNVVLLLVGQGEEKENIERKIKELEIENNVKMLGIRKDIPELLHAMDIFLFPSVFEGFGLALLEAQGSGVKCFTSKDVVPEDVNVTNNVKFISLEKDAKYWAEEILNDLSEISDRETNIIEIKKIMSEKGYDIKTEAMKLQKYFEEN